MASNGVTVPVTNGDARPLNRADEVEDVSAHCLKKKSRKKEKQKRSRKYRSLTRVP